MPGYARRGEARLLLYQRAATVRVSDPRRTFVHERRTMRISNDGYFDLRDRRRVVTPGKHDRAIEPLPLGEALSFLLSHSFPGHRRMVRPPNANECSRLHSAVWAHSVGERMALVDRVWRAITEPVPYTANSDGPHLVQVVRYKDWVYPLHLDGEATRVLPAGGLPVAKFNGKMNGAPQLDLGLARAS